MPWTGENGLEVIGEETRDIKDEIEIDGTYHPGQKNLTHWALGTPG